jgi:hypothetical protein
MKFQSKGQLRTQEKPMFQMSPKAEKEQYSSSRHSGSKDSLICGRISLFVVLRPSTDWVRSTYTGEGHLLYSVYQLKC